MVRVSEHQWETKRKKKVSVRLLIYDAVSVINTALLSHLDALIDTCSGGAYGPRNPSCESDRSHVGNTI